jgi:hypothetical protein
MCPAKTVQNLKDLIALKDREQPIQENLEPDGQRLAAVQN